MVQSYLRKITTHNRKKKGCDCATKRLSDGSFPDCVIVPALDNNASRQKKGYDCAAKMVSAESLRAGSTKKGSSTDVQKC